MKCQRVGLTTGCIVTLTKITIGKVNPLEQVKAKARVR